jgi:activating signal cointegrator complex subunit 2
VCISPDDALLGDRSFIEQMKADILRRAEDMYDSEEIVEGENGALAYEDDDVDVVKVLGDGEGSDEEGAEGGTESRLSPETILELAYIRDPKLFERDAQTRRGKARSELKAQTGWGDEQIEGWRIMLERNVSPSVCNLNERTET